MSTRDTSILSGFDLGGVSRYDLVLAIIPAVFVLALLVADLLSIPPQLSLALASIVAAGAVFDALFLNPPSRAGGPGSA